MDGNDQWLLLLLVLGGDPCSATPTRLAAVTSLLFGQY